MPKSKGKGGKKRKGAKNQGEYSKRELVFKEEGTEYAQVLRMLGNGRVEAHCFDGQKRLCHIRGSMRKKVWINQNDIILVGLRDFQDNKADICHKYNPDEVRQLKNYGEIPESIKVNDSNAESEYDNENIIFSMDAGEQPEIQEKPSDDEDDEEEQEEEDFDVDNI